MTSRRRWLTGKHAAAALVGMVAVAGCGASATGGYHAAATKGAASGSGSGAVVATHDGPLGTYLVDGQGRALYEFANDKSGTSVCSGSCATYWPPITTTGAAHAGAGVTSGMLGTTMRADGSTQVTYAGHPLYRYVGDSGTGDTKGQGLNTSGGLWWLLSPAGARITATGAQASPSDSDSYKY